MSYEHVLVSNAAHVNIAGWFQHPSPLFTVLRTSLPNVNPMHVTELSPKCILLLGMGLFCAVRSDQDMMPIIFEII
jgi:hypothetical protein